jgi:hypothetical protein
MRSTPLAMLGAKKRLCVAPRRKRSLCEGLTAPLSMHHLKVSPRGAPENRDADACGASLKVLGLEERNTETGT